MKRVVATLKSSPSPRLPVLLVVVVAAIACSRPPAVESHAPEDGGEGGADATSDAAIVDAGIADAAPDTTTEAGPREMNGADWEVIRGVWSFDGGVMTCMGVGGSSLVMWRRDRPKDFDASFEVRFDVDDASVGLVFREVTAGKARTLYQLEWYTRGTHHDRRLSLMVRNPEWTQIVEPLVREPPMRRWFPMRVRARGERIEAWADGALVFDKTDATFARAGRVGVHSFQNRPVRVRAFRLEVLDGASAPATGDAGTR